MEAMNGMIVLEQSRVSPPPGTVGDRSLPLTFFDIMWICFHPVHKLFFYEFPHPTDHLTETVVLNLKHSLSIALQHFFPFAGNLIIFPYESDRKPEIRHLEGDSVSFSVVECRYLDFDDLTGNHPRDARKFYPLVPPLPNAVKKPDNSIEAPVFSVQVTLFPNHGICLGITNHHALCDASCQFDFLSAWTSIARLGGLSVQPFYGRIASEEAKRLTEFFWSIMRLGVAEGVNSQPQLGSSSTNYNNKVRATFVMTGKQIESLKEQVVAQRPNLMRVSSFNIVCAYVWCCILESRFANREVKDVEDEHEDEDEIKHEYFSFAANIRERLDPPLPSAYFGNGVGGGIAAMEINRSTKGRKQRFVAAVELIKVAIHEAVNNEDGSILKALETFLRRLMVMVDLSKIVGISGTTKLKTYDIDFGWGKPKKLEIVSIDYSAAISLSLCRDSAVDHEIGLSFSEDQMNAFVKIFNEGLENLTE